MSWHERMNRAVDYIENNLCEEIDLETIAKICLERIRESGYAMKLDFDGEPCRWTFESYNQQRFFMPDDEGKVIMDYCVYVVESEGKLQASKNRDEPVGQDP